LRNKIKIPFFAKKNISAIGIEIKILKKRVENITFVLYSLFALS
jgi:hypothetical protein